MTPEGTVKKEIKARMKAMAPTSWDYMPPGGPYGKAGVMDHIFCVPMQVKPEHVGKTIGVFVGIEAKSDTGRPTKNQEIQIRAVREAGGLAVWVRPQSLDSTLQQIAERLGL